MRPTESANNAAIALIDRLYTDGLADPTWDSVGNPPASSLADPHSASAPVEASTANTSWNDLDAGSDTTSSLSLLDDDVSGLSTSERGGVNTSDTGGIHVTTQNPLAQFAHTASGARSDAVVTT